MSNLISNYGVDWFTSKFGGAMFWHRGAPARVHKATREGVLANFVVKHAGKIKPVQALLPHSEFVNSDRFNAPDLGYRHMAGGKILVFIRRENTSYVRAVALRNIRAEESQLTTQVLNSDLISDPITDDDLHYAIMQPGFIPMHKGIELLRQRKMLSFAASPVIAVEQSPELDGSLNILAAGKSVGTVSVDGTVNITLPFAINLIEDLK